MNAKTVGKVSEIIVRITIRKEFTDHSLDLYKSTQPDSSFGDKLHLNKTWAWNRANCFVCANVRLHSIYKIGFAPAVKTTHQFQVEMDCSWQCSDVDILPGGKRWWIFWLPVELFCQNAKHVKTAPIPNLTHSECFKHNQNTAFSCSFFLFVLFCFCCVFCFQLKWCHNGSKNILTFSNFWG